VANHYRSNPQYASQSKLITLFSGDAYNPSLESSVTKGRHMVPILNNLETDAACVGVSMKPFSFEHVASGSGTQLMVFVCRIMTLILEFLNFGI